MLQTGLTGSGLFLLAASVLWTGQLICAEISENSARNYDSPLQTITLLNTVLFYLLGMGSLMNSLRAYRAFK